VAKASQVSDVLPTVHARALEATGGTCSVLFTCDSRTGRLHATSGFALDEIDTGAWTPGPLEARILDEAFRDRSPLLVRDAVTDAPDFSRRLLRSPAVLLVPLVDRGRRAGLLAVGLPGAAGPPGHAIDEIGDALLLALELFRLREREALQRDLRELLDEFTATVSATLDVGAGLDIVCRRANRLFGADRTAVWVHDRKARHLLLRASSDRQQAASGASVSRDDLLAPPAAAMQRSRSAALPREGPTRTITVPLRGYRRALGALVLEGVRVEAGDESSLLDRADEVGRQVSSAIDSLQLLDEVLGARRELEALFDSMPSLIVVADAQGRIVHANDAFARRLHTTTERIRGRGLEDCVGPDLGRWLAVQPRVTRERSPGTPATCELVDPMLGGPLMITVTGRLDRDRRPSGLVVVARDLTSSRLDADREQERLRLTQSEKLAALGQFVAGIAHELNNPLQGVLGHIELLRATRGLPRSQRPALKAIHREADRAAKIVRNLLAFTGSRRMTRRSVNLNNILQRVVAFRRASGRTRDVEVVRHYAAHVPRVDGDPLLLHQVFLNLIMNAEEAVAATGRPGRIEITTAVSASGDRVQVVIRDTGEGIPVEAFTRIFEPFYTTKDVGQGTGLGLPIAYGIVQEHGGRIAAANDPAGGAMFTVELPAAPVRTDRP
jgi:PAS domain S-box-containing protein